jgi:rare lipoprotein A
MFFFWAIARSALLIALVSTVVDAPLVARPADPVEPLRVWRGVASWYGSPFHGRVTANGERYDMYALTAAHPSLPLGSWVRVERPRSGRSVIVRINDRGPYIEGREIDLSYRAACLLGIDRQGLARVRFELLELPPRRRWPIAQAAD